MSAESGSTRLLVVGASPMRAQAFATWARMGLDVVLVDGHSQGRYEDLIGEFHALDARDESADAAHIARTVGPCDGVVTLADDSQILAAQIAEAWSLPTVGTGAAQAARSKAIQRQRCHEHGLAVPRWREIRSTSDIDAFYADGITEAVIKPADAAGGAGALRVPDRAEALRHWPIVKSLSASRTGVLEEYLPGREVCVDGVIQNGELYFVASVEVEHMRGVGFLCTSSAYASEYCWLKGDAPASADAARAVEMTARVIEALDARDGIVHAEFKIDGDRWTTVETGMRPGGALVPELVARVSGVDLYESQARVALGLDPVRQRGVTAPFAQGRYLVGEGKVRGFVPPAEVLDGLGDVRVVVQQLLGGQNSRIPLSEAGRAGYAYGWGGDRCRLDSQLRVAVDRLGRSMGVTVRGNDPSDPAASEHGPGPWWNRGEAP